jgi:hypothetical protein
MNIISGTDVLGHESTIMQGELGILQIGIDLGDLIIMVWDSTVENETTQEILKAGKRMESITVTDYILKASALTQFLKLLNRKHHFKADDCK